MDNTSNIFEQLIKYITPVISFIIVLLGYIWSRQINDFRKWLTSHNEEIEAVKKEQRSILHYVNDELKELNKQAWDRDMLKNDRLNETREDVRELKSIIESLKVICDVRHNR